MKHNIIIAGVPRAGKSTLSRRVARSFGYQHLSMDSIIAGFEQHFPELGINTYANLPSEVILRTISVQIAPFLNTMMDRGDYDELGRGIVLDVYQLLPEDYVKHIRRDICDIYYLITAEVTPEERFTIFKTYDTPKDYTFFKSDDELRDCCRYSVEQSRLIQEQCRQHNLPCYETSKNRPSVFEEVLQEISRRKSNRESATE